MRRPLIVLMALLGCGGTEPDYPPLDGPSPTVSDFTLNDRVATAIVRDREGAATVGQTDYTYVFFNEDGSNDSQVSFAPEWTWARLDDLTWRVTVPNLRKDWLRAGWHVADQDANVQPYICTPADGCEEVPTGAIRF